MKEVVFVKETEKVFMEDSFNYVINQFDVIKNISLCWHSLKMPKELSSFLSFLKDESGEFNPVIQMEVSCLLMKALGFKEVEISLPSTDDIWEDTRFCDEWAMITHFESRFSLNKSYE